MNLLTGDTLKNKVWQIRVDDEWLRWIKAAAEEKKLSAAAYLRMIALDRVKADGIPRPDEKPKPKRRDA